MAESITDDTVLLAKPTQQDKVEDDGNIKQLAYTAQDVHHTPILKWLLLSTGYLPIASKKTLLSLFLCWALRTKQSNLKINI